MSGNSWRVETIRVDKIVPNKHQPRKNFDREKSNELGESIKGAGQVELIMVRPITDGRYEIISGHRRFQEQKKSGEKGISVLIKEGLDEKRSALEAFVSNECRNDLNPFERARAIRRIQTLYKKETQEELGHLLGMSRSAVQIALTYEGVAEEIREKTSREGFSFEAARELTRLDSPEEQVAVSKIVEESKLTGLETGKLVSAINKAAQPIKEEILSGKIDPHEAIDGRERKEIHRHLNKDEVVLDKLEKAKKVLGFPDPVLGIRLHILSTIENPQTHEVARKIMNDIVIFLTEELEYDRIKSSGIKQLGDGK